MKTCRQSLGQCGEDLAVQYLRQRGYKILKQNFRIGRAEIDIIALDQDDLILVEVKSIRTNCFGQGEEHITSRKKVMLIRAAYRFLDLFPAMSGKNLRFDVMVTDFTAFPAVIRHYQGAFWQQS
jgi:putative endonuclease